MNRLTHHLVLIGFATVSLAAPSLAAPPCAGDCDRGGSVTVDELIKGIGIALGTGNVDECLSIDTSGDRVVTVDEIVNGVTNGLQGCPTFDGEFFAAVTLDAGRSATVELDVQENGQASALVTISEASGLRALLGGGSGAVSLTVTGTVNLDTGVFTLSGSYTDGAVTRSVNLSGSLPLGSGAHGSLTFQLDSTNFTGSIARGSGSTPTPTPVTAVPTPTATAMASGPIDPNIIGTWSGTARNETTGVIKNVRIKVELQGSSVVVTDLGGNLYKTPPASITMNAPTRTTLTYNTFANPVIVFNLTYGNDMLAGIYSATTAAIPPVIDAVGVVLTKEVPLAPDPRLAGTWGGNNNPLTPQPVRLRLEIQGDVVLVTDLLGDLFVSLPSPITMRPEGIATALTFVCAGPPTCGPGQLIVTLNMNLLPNGRLVGSYREDRPGVSTNVGFGLIKE